MRRLVNRYMEWATDLDCDGAGFLIRLGTMVVILTVLVILFCAPIVLGLSLLPSNTGSCKVGHYTMVGKTVAFVCDEYYPTPEVR